MIDGLGKPVSGTGGAVCVGSHLCHHLLDRDCEISCVDHFFADTAATVAPLQNTGKLELLRHDVTMPLHVELDEIINLACPASPAPLPVGSGADDRNLGSWRGQNAWIGQAGPPRDPSGVEDITVYSDGSQMRSFCFVDDLVEGLVA